MIYIVEDDGDIREMMLYTLRSTGFQATGFPDAAAFWQALRTEKPELALLDVMLPGEDGIEILKKLRAGAATRAIPVIMATARGTEHDKITGLDLGADDYLAKPFGMLEMVYRVRAVLRRAAPARSGREYSFGGIVLSDAEHTVTADGRAVTLTLKEYEMLRVFLEEPGRVFTRENLLESVWGMDYDGETRTVDVHIRTLRQKLGASGGCIGTVRGVGYRLEESGE